MKSLQNLHYLYFIIAEKYEEEVKDLDNSHGRDRDRDRDNRLVGKE